MAARTVNVLSLCSGYGGLDIAVRSAIPSSRTVCYVEREVPVVAVLAARMAVGALDAAPVWSDITSFPAKRWRGVVDLVVAGFPCQPVSVAGRQLGLADPRWLWPHVFRIARESGAGAMFLENVPGLVGKGLQSILEDLASFGWDAEWGCLDAGAVGATHLRDRWFCLAYPRCERPWWLESVSVGGREGQTESLTEGTTLAYPHGGRLEEFGCGGLLDGERTPLGHDADGQDAEVEHASESGLEGFREGLSGHAGYPPLPGDERGWSEWPGPQPAVCRASDGAAGRLHRLRMLGNGVVPEQAAEALRRLVRRAQEHR